MLARGRATTHMKKYLTIALTMTTFACGGGFRVAQVSPEEIPELEERLATAPRDGELLLRYSAALFAAGRCDSAVAVARTGMAVRPRDAVGPLVVGQCLEQGEDFSGAVAVYRTYAEAHPDERGVAAVRAREMLALRGQATHVARNAIAREQELADQPTDPDVVAVLPLQIASADTSFLPLSRGLAQILTSDLALLQRFRMVERLQLGAILDEIEFSQGDKVDPLTAVRVGRLMRAGRMVQGLVVIPPEQDVRLEASVILSTGEVTDPTSATGPLRDLLRIEKEIVVGLAGQMGYQLSQAERASILENGTQNLAAFLAYSSALVAEDQGDYSAAAVFYAQAVQQDPGFDQARSGYEATAVAATVAEAGAGEVVAIAAETAEEPEAVAEQAAAETAPTTDVVANAIDSTVGDIASTTAEQTASTGAGDTTEQATTTTTSEPPTTTTNEGTTATVTGTIRVVFKLP